MEDLEGVLDIYNHYVISSVATFDTVPFHPEDRRAWMGEHLGDGPHKILVAADSDGKVIGWATSSQFRPRAAYSTTVELSVYCRHDSLGRGTGRRLYKELLASLLPYDLEMAVAGVTLPNPQSVKLHQSLGFRHVGTFRRIGRKFGKYWDVAWFERPFRPSFSEWA